MSPPCLMLVTQSQSTDQESLKPRNEDVAVSGEISEPLTPGELSAAEPPAWSFPQQHQGLPGCIGAERQSPHPGAQKPHRTEEGWTGIGSGQWWWTAWPGALLHLSPSSQTSQVGRQVIWFRRSELCLHSAYISKFVLEGLLLEVWETTIQASRVVYQHNFYIQ